MLIVDRYVPQLPQMALRVEVHNVYFELLGGDWLARVYYVLRIPLLRVALRLQPALFRRLAAPFIGICSSGIGRGNDGR